MAVNLLLHLYPGECQVCSKQSVAVEAEVCEDLVVFYG